MRRCLAILAVFILLAAAPALAQEQPQLRPQPELAGGPGAPPPPGPGMGPGGGPDGDRGDPFLLQRLLRLPDLTDEQRGRLCGEAYEIVAEMNHIHMERTNTRLKLACSKLRPLEDIDPGEVKALYAEVGRLDGDLFEAHHRLNKLIHSILTSEQIEFMESHRPGRRPGMRKK